MWSIFQIYATVKDWLQSSDEPFARIVRATGWGLGVWAAVTGRLDGNQIVALVIAFVGFEFVAKKRDKELR